MGLMVVQDMPAMPTFYYPKIDKPLKDKLPTPAQQAAFESQLARMVEQLKSHPSIVTWVIYNEGWGQDPFNSEKDYNLTDLVRSLDPTRLIDTVTGWNDHGAGDYHVCVYLCLCFRVD
jgi:beta-galactosidase/beta-glucuronidase